MAAGVDSTDRRLMGSWFLVLQSMTLEPFEALEYGQDRLGYISFCFTHACFLVPICLVGLYPSILALFYSATQFFFMNRLVSLYSTM